MTASSLGSGVPVNSARGGDEVLGVGLAPSMEPSGRGQHDPGVVLARCRPRWGESVEVLGVLGHHSRPGGRRGAQEIVIGQGPQLGIVRCRPDVVAVLGEPLGDTADYLVMLPDHRRYEPEVNR